MLNPFPIQFLALLAHLLLRVITGVVLLILGYQHFKHRTTLYLVLSLSIFPFGKITTFVFIVTELTIGTLLILGMHTQIAALLLIAMSVKMLFLRKWFPHLAIPGRLFYLLLLGISCSLFITGAGALAFDLPL